MIEALAQAIERAGSVEAVAVARALEQAQRHASRGQARHACARPTTSSSSRWWWA